MDTREGCKGEGREDGEGVMGDDGDLPPYFSRVSCAKILMELHLHDVCGLYTVCVYVAYTLCVCIGLHTVCVYGRPCVAVCRRPAVCWSAC